MGPISDFQAQLQKRAPASFGCWHRVDLHNHTPISSDYLQKDPGAPDRLIERINQAHLSAVMFTDHNALPAKELLEEVRAKTQCLIIPGIELNMFVDAVGDDRKVGRQRFYHLLLGFDPSDNPDFLWTKIVREGKLVDRPVGPGGEIIRGLDCTLSDLAKLLEGSQTIIIPAHLHSNHSRPEKSRSLDDIFQDALFLKSARQHCDALEVTDEATAAYFDGKHDETERLHKSCVWSSDSHKPDDLGTRTAYVQVQSMSFHALKTALRMPHRVHLHEPPVPAEYLVGMHINGYFLNDLWIQLSPHCNALIAVKGAGKTALLECMRFVLGSAVPESKRDAVQKHLEHVLGPSGKVTALVKRRDGELQLIERAISDTYFTIRTEGGSQHTVDTPKALGFDAQILGWHEIEDAAVTATTRMMYMDAVAGRAEMDTIHAQLTEQIAVIAGFQREAVLANREFRRLDAEVSRLQRQRDALRHLEDDNLVTLAKEYERASSQQASHSELKKRINTQAARVKQHIDKLVDGISIMTADTELDSVIDGSMSAMSALNHWFTSTSDAAEVEVQRVAQSVTDNDQKVHDVFRQFRERYQERIRQLPDDQQLLLREHQRVTDETSKLDTLTRQRDELRNSLTSLIERCKDSCAQAVETLERRAQKRVDATEALAKAISNQGVRVRVRPYALSPNIQQFQSLSISGAATFREVLPGFKGPSCLHELHDVFETLTIDLSHTQAQRFLEADYQPYVGLVEDDDLEVELNVSKNPQAEQFRKIDQLSAGQRCTAFFPILLSPDGGPLIIDQPEDNLDNRHIAATIVPSLVVKKMTRQMAITSHNANLVVMSDPELIVAFESDGTTGHIDVQGFFEAADSPITQAVKDILDGGEAALRQRLLKYGIHV